MPRRGTIRSMLVLLLGTATGWRPALQLVAMTFATLLLVATLLVQPAAAQDAGRRPTANLPASLPLTHLPADRQSSHTMTLPDRALRFTATAGSILVVDEGNAIKADLAFVAYTLDGAEPKSRPVVFAFNGGPGSASTWLHLGAIGPWRVPLSTATIAAKGTPALIDNAETWLDFADLVFIDPPGTGFSRIWPPPKSGEGQAAAPDPPEGARQGAGPGSGPGWFWSLRGDISTFAYFIHAWVKRTDRTESPIVLVGESYGGFRSPLIAETLARERTMPVRAMVLVSPVLDFDGRRGGHLPQHYIGLLPSLAATRMERSGVTATRVALSEVEGYARGDYLLDLMRGARDYAALDRISAKVANFTGLEVEHVRSHHGRINIRNFVGGLEGVRKNTISVYDAGMAGFEPPRNEPRGGFGDPFISGLTGPLTLAMGTVYGKLGWKADRPYVMHSSETNRSWRWRNSPHPPESLSALQVLTQSDRRLRSLVVHGYTDLVTPYFASALQLDQLASHGAEQRIKLEVYNGGHMFYSNDASRARFRSDAGRLIGEVMGAGARKGPVERGETSQ